MATVPKQRLTPEEYLAQERKAEFKSEYLNGEVFAMAEASFRHAQIVSNLVLEFGHDDHCRAYAADLRCGSRLPASSPIPT